MAPDTMPSLAETAAEELAQGASSLSLEESAPTDTSLASHRSHDPQYNMKRSDPFQFGSRYLEENDDVFEFNAWDHVETDDVYKEYAEQQFAMQRASPVSDFDKRQYIPLSIQIVELPPHWCCDDTPIMHSSSELPLMTNLPSILSLPSDTPTLRCLMFCSTLLVELRLTIYLTDRFNSDPAKWWNLFYKNNTANFFKNRKWLQQEFPILADVTREDAGPVTILEVGAGAGNSAFPILANNKNPKLKVHACDYSKQAVQVMRNHEAYDPEFMQADVWDAAGQDLPPGIQENTVDVVVMVFIFSALSPSQWDQAVTNIHRVLKPGGQVCFRDYGRGDLAQVRFKKGRYLEENFYIRGDGTRVYFFEKDELSQIWTRPSSTESNDAAKTDEANNNDSEHSANAPFEIEELGFDRRLLVNRARRLKMYRCWIQGRFRKK
jgi:tRNAThr (cytosine32-N3)-methyltransferase